jgi:lysophospholipase L1-like esterase
VSGDNFGQIWARWQADVLDHDPDIVFIFAGINDLADGLDASV